MDASEFEQLLSDVETRLDRLKALYEQWFQGLERLEPTVPRKAVERGLAALRREQPRNTALRFRFQSLQQKWNTYTTYWQRIARQIEEGTYRRDLLRARRRRQQARELPGQGVDRTEASTPELEVDIDVEHDFDVDAALDALDAARLPSQPGSVRPAATGASPPGSSTGGGSAPARPAVALSPFGSVASRGTASAGRTGSPSTGAGRSTSASAPVPPHPGGGSPPSGRRPVSVFPPPTPVAGTPAAGGASRPPMAPSAGGRGGRVPDEGRLRQIYDQYLQARRSNNERTDNVPFETVAKSIRQMVPKLQKKHAGKRIDFEVVVKDGRVGLKPVARKT
ncbi:MAG TPA: MXAN_5187 C-terminal domain-containing protein [Polyangiaceae bacterium LLY-WYZ-14_1]|nr:MXAN_5187 C-terminal domain-containing protein [Polyangiaceae bacterium LLY-WYZ-14_1]